MEPLPDGSTGHQGVVAHDGGHRIGGGRQIQYEQVPVAMGFEHHRIPGQRCTADTDPADGLTSIRMPGDPVKALENDAPPVELVCIR